MDLQWNLCPFCGNQQVNPYKVDVTPRPVDLPESDEVDEPDEETAVIKPDS
jgi:hypothetical protein